MKDGHRRSFLKTALLASASLTYLTSSYAQAVDSIRESSEPSQRHPIYYWNRAALTLIRIDHSIPAAEEALAPGPCASARVLGLMHAAMADAASHAYSAEFPPKFNPTTPDIGPDDPALFVGGAAWGVLSHVYKGKIYEGFLSTAMADFMSYFGSTEPNKTWDNGVAFGLDQAFTGHWKSGEILARLRDQNYSPVVHGNHKVDPLNPAQGFYGLKWGEQPPLVLSQADITRFVEGELRRAPPIDQDEIDFIIAKGSRYPRDAGKYKARKDPEERNIGLYWAYDGAFWVGIPSIIYNQTLAAVARTDGLTDSNSIPKTARLFALCNLAMADASIVAWEAKWRVALWRPVVAIRETAEENWQPYGAPRSNPDGTLPLDRFAKEFGAYMLGIQPGASSTAEPVQTILGASPSASLAGKAGIAVPPDREYARAAFTPNFPAYPSGHATIGASCYKSILNVRSQDASISKPNKIAITVPSLELNGTTSDNYSRKPRPKEPQSFKRLTAVGNDRRQFDRDSLAGSNNESRIFLGVHWSFDQTDGDLAGKIVADIVATKAYPIDSN